MCRYTYVYIYAYMYVCMCVCIHVCSIMDKSNNLCADAVRSKTTNTDTSCQAAGTHTHLEVFIYLFIVNHAMLSYKKMQQKETKWQLLYSICQCGSEACSFCPSLYNHPPWLIYSYLSLNKVHTSKNIHIALIVCPCMYVWMSFFLCNGEIVSQDFYIKCAKVFYVYILMSFIHHSSHYNHAKTRI